MRFVGCLKLGEGRNLIKNRMEDLKKTSQVDKLGLIKKV